MARWMSVFCMLAAGALLGMVALSWYRGWYWGVVLWGFACYFAYDEAVDFYNCQAKKPDAEG